MNSQDLFINAIFYTKKRYIAEKYFPQNITLFDIKKYFKENIEDGTTIFYKNYYLNRTIKLNDSDMISKLIVPSSSSSILGISIAIELREVDELKYQFSLIKFDDENEEIYSQIIKPKLNPFELIVFLTNNSTIQIEQYPLDILKKYKLDKFNANYAFCNSPNFLFLSGENNFWIINKKTYSIKRLKLKISKNNHSMLYVHNFGVFVVGGDTNKTYYYDIKNNKFKIWGNTMSNNTVKPALIFFDDYLYCFQILNEKNNYFEKTYLGENTQKKWEIIYPRFKGINPNQFYNNNFAVSKSIEGKILFVGGNNKNSFVFNNLNDTIMKAEGKNENILFDEKIFYKLNKVMNIAIPSDFEKSKEIAIVNKYQFSLQKIKYKNSQNYININKELNFENNLNIINDNQIGNFSLQGKFKRINKNKKKEEFTFIRTYGIPVFNQINYIKFSREFPKCICQYHNHGSQTNLLKNKKEIDQIKILKRNKSQLIKQRNDEIEIKVNNKKIDENKNKNIINIIQKQSPIKLEKVINEKKNEISNNINIQIQKKENEKTINNENIDNTVKKNIEKNNEKIIDIKKDDLIKNENNREKSPNREIIDKIKKEEKNSEMKIETVKKNEINNDNENIKINTNQRHNENFNIFSQIKEIRQNPNYDIDESKLNKDFDISIVTNFQLKESIQKNIYSNQSNMNSGEKNHEDEKIIENKDDKSHCLENIKIKDYIENNYIHKEEENTKEKEYNETQKEKQNDKSIDNYQIKEAENKTEDYIKNQLKEIQNNEQGKLDEIQSSECQIEQPNNEINNVQIENEEQDNNEQIEEKSEKNLIDENKVELQDNIEQEINKQKVHEDMEPNQLMNINKNTYIKNEEDKQQGYQYKENLEDYMAQNIEEDNDDGDINSENLEDNEYVENNNIEDENIISQNNEDMYNSESEEIKKNKNEETIKKGSNIKDEFPIMHKNIKSNSDFKINYNQEESKEPQIKNKNSKEYLSEEINLNYSNKITENIKDSNKKNLEEENSPKIDNNEVEQFQEINNNEEEEENNYEEGEFQEENDEEYNYEENEEEQMEEDYEVGENDNNEMSYEIDDNEGKKEKEKERDSIIHISDDNFNKDEIIKKEKDLQKYQKFIKHFDYDEPDEFNNLDDEK